MVPSQPNPLPAAAAATAAAAAEETPLCNQDTSMYTNKLILAPMVRINTMPMVYCITGK